MLNFREKKVVVFDWDGTLFDSMKLKSANFAQAVWDGLSAQEKENLSLERVENAYRKFSGQPRKVVVSLMLQDLVINEKTFDYPAFNALLTRLNVEKLIAADIFDDVAPLLDGFHEEGKWVFVSSSAPQEELNVLVKQKLKGLFGRFKGVFGSSDGFAKGRAHIEHIGKQAMVEKNNILFIGDDFADFELSKEAGIEFVMIDRTGKISSKEFPIVQSLGSLKGKI